jgi:hypothetical protein
VFKLPFGFVFCSTCVFARSLPHPTMHVAACSGFDTIVSNGLLLFD